MSNGKRTRLSLADRGDKYTCNATGVFFIWVLPWQASLP